MSVTTLDRVVADLVAEQLFTDSDGEAVAAVINQMGDQQPWYIRAMVGAGAWLASLLLIGFVATIGSIADGGFIVVGLSLIVAAIFVRKQSASDFIIQSTLACSLAGQALLAYGIAEAAGAGRFENYLMFAVFMSTVLFLIFPDRVHRVIMVLIAASSFGTLLYSWELNPIVPVIGPVLAGLLVYLQAKQGLVIEQGHGKLLRPLLNGLVMASFGFLMLSTIYVLPELVDDYVFYPRSWISTILLGGILLYVCNGMWSQIAGAEKTVNKYKFATIILAIVIAAWAMPGLLLALIVILLGASSGNRSFVGVGIAFLTIFVGTYFYGIDISMMQKSLTLVATGLAMFGARWFLLTNLAGSSGEENSDD